MGAFGGLILTNKGRNLQAKAQTGVELHYTRIAIGDGELGGRSIVDLNALVSEKLSLTISKLKVLTGGKAVVGTVLSNQNVSSGFYFREIGVFAQDPNEGEILYCYGNCGPTAEYIPAGGGPDVIEKTIDVITLIGNASNVTATLDSSLIWETPEGAQAKVDAHALQGGNAHPVATQTTAGFMSAADKLKLDGIQSGAEVNQNAFTTIDVKNSGGTSKGAAIADNKTDTLTFKEGTGITLTPSASSDEITVAVNPSTALATPTQAGFMPAEDKDALQSMSKYRSGYDSELKVYTTVEYKRKDGTRYMRSVLSNKVNGQYTVRTETYYATNGTTVSETEVYDITYDSDGNPVNEVLR